MEFFQIKKKFKKLEEKVGKKLGKSWKKVGKKMGKKLFAAEKAAKSLFFLFPVCLMQ